jgi:arsenite-transporting ATPase
MKMSSSPSTLTSIAERPTATAKKEPTQFVFVGGKGGVGKTTSSSAIALSLADKGHRTLLVSTDPAHSLGDALDIDLSSGRLVKINTESNLWCMEVDAEAALKEFEDLMSGVTSESLSKSLGVPKEIIDTLGLQDATELLTNPPPGIDGESGGAHTDEKQDTK